MALSKTVIMLSSKIVLHHLHRERICEISMIDENQLQQVHSKKVSACPWKNLVSQIRQCWSLSSTFFVLDEGLVRDNYHNFLVE